MSDEQYEPAGLVAWSKDTYHSEPDKQKIIRDLVDAVNDPPTISLLAESIYHNLAQQDIHSSAHLWAMLGYFQAVSLDHRMSILSRPFADCDDYLRRLCQACAANLRDGLMIQRLLCGHVPIDTTESDEVERLFKQLLEYSDDIDLGVTFLQSTKLPQPYPIITMRQLSQKPSALQVYTLLATSDFISSTRRNREPIWHTILPVTPGGGEKCKEDAETLTETEPENEDDLTEEEVTEGEIELTEFVEELTEGEIELTEFVDELTEVGIGLPEEGFVEMATQQTVGIKRKNGDKDEASKKRQRQASPEF